MPLETGTYVMVSVLNTGYALDVQNGSDSQDGRRVQLFQRNDSDAQLVRVVPDGGRQKVLFILSGMALDRKDGGTADGTALQQWSAGAGNAAQQWIIKEDGGSVTVGGSSLPTYTLAAPSDQTQVLDVQWGTISNGTPLQMYEANGTDSQRWAFVPQGAVPDGTWAIHTALADKLVIDVSGNSQANGANVQIYSGNGTNAQAWRTLTADGVTTILNAASNKALDVQNGSPANGTNVQVYERNGTEAQRWVIEPSDATAVSNGSVVPLYVIHAVSGTGRCLDVANGGTQIQTNVQVFDSNGTASQRFWFEPTEYLADGLPVPSGGGIAESDGGVPSATILSRGDVTAFPSWLCDGSEYQLRYRLSERPSSDDATDVSNFGDWMDARSGSTGNGGWGEVQTANVTGPERDGTRVWSPHGIDVSVSTDGTDRVDIQFDVRRFAGSYGETGACAHGGSATFSTRVCWLARLTGLSAVFTPNGLRVFYSSDFPRGGNSMTISSEGLFDAHTYQGLASSGYVDVPVEDMFAVPREGEGISLSIDFSTCDAKMPRSVESVNVSYDSGHGTSVDVSAEVEGTLATVTATKGASVWMLVHRGHRDRFVPIDVSGGSAKVAPPLGVPWRLFATISDGEAWASKSVEYEAIPSVGWHMSPLDMSSDYEVFVTDSFGGAKAVVSYERDSTTVVTTGREREVVGFGSTVKANWSVDGVLIGDDLDEQTDGFDRVAHSTYVVFRDPFGFWAQAAVMSSSIDRSVRRFRPVSLSFREIVA